MAQAEPTEPRAPVRRPDWRRRAMRVAIGAAIAAVLLCIAAPLALSPFVRGKLEGLVADHLHATLKVQSLTYWPPYRLHVRGARIIANGSDVELLNVGELNLMLAELPFRRGPLLIEKLVLREPRVHLVRTSGGNLLGRELYKRKDESKQDESSRRMKLSDVFRLRKLTLERGRIVYDDRAQPQAEPMVWNDLTIDADISPTSPADYTFAFEAGNAPLAKLIAGGSINIDELVLAVDRFEFDARLERDGSSSSLPAPVQQALRERAITSGRLHVERLAGRTNFRTRAWQIDDLRGRLDLSSGSVEFAGALDHTLEGGTLTATFHDVTFQPPRFPQPLQRVSGRLWLSDAVFHVEHFQAKYGRDDWSLVHAIARLEGSPRRLRLSEISGAVGFSDRAATPYPMKLGPIVASLGPSGVFNVYGDYTFDPGIPKGTRQRHLYDLRIASAEGNFAVTQRRIPIQRIRGEARVTRDLIDLPNVQADVLGGSLAVAGTVIPRSPVSYGGQIELRDVDLARVTEFFHIDGQSDSQITGRGGLRATVTAQSPQREALQAQGEVELIDARLWKATVLSHVVKEVKVTEEALSASEAAAVFEMRDATVHLHRAAIQSAGLGVQGSGTIGLDGALDLKLVAAPLGDWQRQMQKLQIPIVGDVAAGILGGFQQMVNAATRELLYEFRVTGHASEPKFETVPSPALTEGVAQLFGQMLRKEKSLMDVLREAGKP